MRSPRRLVVPAIALVVLGAACTDDGGTNPPSDGPTGGTQPSSPATTTLTPGRFEYSNGGLTVTLQLEGSTGTMEVDNGSGHALGKPDLYVIDGVSTKRFDGKVIDAAPTEDGAQATFQVEFPPEVTAKSLGLVILLFGSDNYGAFAPA